MSMSGVKRVLEEMGFTPSRFKGQNFLIDANIQRKIIDSLKINKEDKIIEIGPGPGVLTEQLVNLGKKVFAIEIEPAFCRHLEQIFIGKRNFSLIEGDAAEEEIIRRLINRQRGKKSFKIIGNLPYAFATKIIMNLIKFIEHIEVMVFMVQKEMAERILAPTGTKERGYLTLYLELFCHTSKLFDVPPTCFYPKPKVHSSVIKLIPAKKEISSSLPFLLKVIQAGFHLRRKKLKNSLFSVFGEKLDLSSIEEILKKAGIEENCRAEELEIEDFDKIAFYLERSIAKIGDI